MTSPGELTREDLECLAGLSDFNDMPPPRMTMDEYCDFVWEMLQYIPPEQIDRQKKLEKQIKVAFRM